MVNWHSIFFLAFALLACVSALAVVISGNIVRMACYLVVSLGAVAGLFFLAGADFLGAVQLMVYVGGTMVLLVFGVMLTSRGRFVSMKTPSGHWIIAILAGGSLLAVLLQTAFTVDDWMVNDQSHQVAKQVAKVDATATPIGMGLLGVRVDKESKNDGKSGYLLPFEIVSVHLLVVLIGAAYLARTRKRKGQEPSPSETNS